MDSTIVLTPYGPRHPVANGQESLCCPTCGRYIRAIWHAGPNGDMKLILVPEKDEQGRYRRWLAENRTLVKQLDD